MTREGEERKRLVRRTTPSTLVRRTTVKVMNDGRTAYYPTGRGVSVVTSPGLMGDWYWRLVDWNEKLLNVLDILEKGDEAVETTKEETTKQVVLALRLMAKAGHVLVLALLAIPYLAYQRIIHLGGSH